MGDLASKLRATPRAAGNLSADLLNLKKPEPMDGFPPAPAMPGPSLKEPMGYDSKMSGGQEADYQTMLQQLQQATGRDWSQDTADYDLRGAFLAGQVSPDGRGHLGDQFKKPWHPTFSDQSQYHGVDGHQGGAWSTIGENQYAFTPGETNGRYWSQEALQRYWDQAEAPDGNVLKPRGQ